MNKFHLQLFQIVADTILDHGKVRRIFGQSQGEGVEEAWLRCCNMTIVHCWTLIGHSGHAQGLCNSDHVGASCFSWTTWEIKECDQCYFVGIGNICFVILGCVKGLLILVNEVIGIGNTGLKYNLVTDKK